MRRSFFIGLLEQAFRRTHHTCAAARFTFSAIHRAILLLGLTTAMEQAQEAHDHPVPEKLGAVSFPITCSPAVQAEFNRGVALLHSFAYAAAADSFRKVATGDSRCAIAHWGIAMTGFHQLWEPPLSARALPQVQQEIATAQKIGSADPRERGYMHAFSLLVTDADTVSFAKRDMEYERAMAELASLNKADVEAQVFYALALLSNAAPTDKTHARQKKALEILEPLDRAYPDHPGITHYIIHACDSTELAHRGEAAARKYAQIAPAAPHALHMPSHIFTRLGFWDESIASNLAARAAAKQQGDVGEELHAMDYLVYAYLQTDRYNEAAQVVESLRAMNNLGVEDFKVGYAATAMPVRFAVERRRWDEAAKIEPSAGSPPHVGAIAEWARALGRTRGANPSGIEDELSALAGFEQALQKAGNQYWAEQVSILTMEARAWRAQALGHAQEAESQMRAAADKEDGLEKLPVTPGPVVPAREQLGDLLLQQHRFNESAEAFQISLVNAPNRKGALDGLKQASKAAE